jgi:ATP-binding protein involved in chromosome partitioning
MSLSNDEQIIEVLQSVTVPYLNQTLVSAKAIKNIKVTADTIEIKIVLGFPANRCKEQLTQQISEILQAKFPNKKLLITVDWQIEAHAVQQNVKGLAGVKNIIAVASGKGGVGKSTTAVNLALALSLEGARVGILDADIYGPNQPQMLGITDHPETTDEKKLKPLIKYNIQAMSIGFLIAQEDTPMVWRGPMVSTALQQLLYDTQWDNLEYLIIDLPPGTGDIQLTLAQKIPVSGAIIITTPQDIALLDVKKAVRMFEKVRVPVLGVVENMSTYLCPHCGQEEAIFGSGGADKIAAQYQLEVLGHLPLALKIRADVDAGKPTVIADVESSIAQTYREIACKTAAQLSLQSKNYGLKFPKIVVENR